MYSITPIKKNISLLKSTFNWSESGFKSKNCAIDCLAILVNHEDSLFTDISFTKNDTLEIVITKVFETLIEKFNASAFYWYEEDKTLRIFKDIDCFDAFKYHAVFFGLFFENYEDFNKDFKEIILSFIHIWFSESFSASEYGFTDWFEEMLLDSCENEKEDEELQATAKLYKFAKKKMDKYSKKKNKKYFYDIVKKYKCQNDFEFKVIDFFIRYEKIDVSIYWDLLKYMPKQMQMYSDISAEQRTTQRLQESNVTALNKLFYLGLNQNDRINGYYEDVLNYNANEGYVITDLYDYMDITNNSITDFRNYNDEILNELPNWMMKFNDLLNTYETLKTKKELIN